MKIERTKNATRNMVFGTILRIYQLAVPFLMRTLMLYYMGVQYLGLNSLFTSVLQVLNLAELGVGSAMIYSMYKPIAEDDEQTICALLKLYKKYYRIIGGVVLGIGLLLLPFLRFLIKGDVPADINIYVLYLLNLLATVATYWLFAYQNSLFQAHQRTDTISKVAILTNTMCYLLQVLVIILAKNYYLYVIAILVTQILNNLIIAKLAQKKYPQYSAKGSLTCDEVQNINHRIRDLFTAKIGGVIVNSADTIVISAFLGLTSLAIYQNYYYLFTAISGMIAIIFNSISAGVGNSIIVESKEKVFGDFKKLLFIIMWITAFSCTCFLCLYQPFVELWVGKELLADFKVVVCLVIYFFIYELNTLLNFYKDASGMWHEDRFRPLVTAVVNLGLNLFLVRYIGLYGIILSTVISMVMVGMPWLVHNLFDVVFEKKKIFSFLGRLGYYVLVTLLICVVTYWICSLIELPLLITVIVRLGICIIVSNIMLLLFCFKMPEFKESILIINRMSNGKLSFLLGDKNN